MQARYSADPTQRTQEAMQDPEIQVKKIRILLANESFNHERFF